MKPKVSEPKESIFDPSKSKQPQAKFIPPVQTDSTNNKTFLTDYSTLKNIYTPADLIKTYGRKNVQERDTYDREGTLMGKEYVLYPNTKNEIIIGFDNNKRNSIWMKNKNSDWKFPYGFYVGMPLKKVIEANGRDFKFYGFEWDYSGMLASVSPPFFLQV